MNPIKNQFLENLFLDQLEEMYDGEQDIARALGKMSQESWDESLRHILKEHATATLGHISRVAEIFACFGRAASGVPGNAIPGLLAAAERQVESRDDALTRDGEIISAWQNVEHYEIATYTCLREWAKVLEMPTVVALIDTILEEEKSSDQQLSKLAQARRLEAMGPSRWRHHQQNEEEETHVRSRPRIARHPHRAPR